MKIFCLFLLPSWAILCVCVGILCSVFSVNISFIIHVTHSKHDLNQPASGIPHINNTKHNTLFGAQVMRVRGYKSKELN